MSLDSSHKICNAALIISNVPPSLWYVQLIWSKQYRSESEEFVLFDHSSTKLLVNVPYLVQN